MKAKSQTEHEKKPVPTEGGAPVLPVMDWADEDVDAGIPERLLPDGTAAWSPRAEDLDLGVPEHGDAEPARADGEEGNAARKAASRGTSGQEQTTAGDKSAPAFAGKSEAGRDASGSKKGRAWPARTASEPELREGPSLVLGPTSAAPASFALDSLGSLGGLAAPAAPISSGASGATGAFSERRVMPDARLITTPGENTYVMTAACAPVEPGPPVPVFPQARESLTAAGAGGLEQSGLIPANIREPEPGRIETALDCGQGRNTPEQPRMAMEGSAWPERGDGIGDIAAGGRTLVEREADRASPTAPVMKSGPAVAQSSLGVARARPWKRAEFRTVKRSGDKKRDARPSVVLNAGACTREDVDAMRAATAIGRPPEAGDAATAARSETVARAGHSGVPVTDVPVLALCEEKTRQAEDGAPIWRAGLPDLSGVNLGRDEGGEAARSERTWMRPARPAAAATSVPANPPAVQVTATLRVDEEELVCAVERLATRQALRG